MTPSFVFARVIFHAEALRVQRRNKHSFEFLMKMLFQYDNPETGSSNPEVYSCWDSERDSFSDNWVMNITVGCINDN